MSTTVLNEHDANQGAQSKGEFLGMTGNSGWCLLGSAGASVLMVIVLWGVFEVSLLLCLLVGLGLCVLAVGYVFTLKNNRPDHYDTDFFEAALVEAGVIELAFGPRVRRAANPFAQAGTAEESATGGDAPAAKSPLRSPARHRSAASGRVVTLAAPAAPFGATEAKRKSANDENEPMVRLSAYESLKADLVDVQEQLEEALVEREED